MTMDAAIRNLLSASPIDEIVVTSQEDYYNNLNPSYQKVCDVIKENNKVIILTR